MSVCYIPHYRPAVLLYIVIVLLALCSTALSVSVEEIKKMKVKELKAFLSARGQECKGCAEKSDYVNMAIRHKDAKVDSAKAAEAGYTGPAPTGKLWEVWAQFAAETAQEIGVSDKAKKIIQNVVENAFMQHGKSTATKLKKTHKDVLKTSLGAPYYTVGRKHLKSLAKFAQSKGDGLKVDEMRKTYEKIFIPWMTNVGIENTNPMYEWMKSKSDEL